MSCMSKADSKQLFLNYALSSEAVPPPWLETYVDKVLKKCGGLPLTLEVLGNYLNSNTKGIWEQTLEALNKADNIVDPDNKLWAKLRLSYNALGEEEQEMFLDATAFFHPRWTLTAFFHPRWTLREAKATWGANHGMEDMRWKTLVDRSLVYDVAEDEEIKVHEQLLSLGQKIACERNHQRRECESMAALNLLLSTDELDKKELYALKVKVGLHLPDIVNPKRLTNLQYLQVESFGRCIFSLFKENLSLDRLVALRSDTGLLFGHCLVDLSRCRRLVVLHLNFSNLRFYSRCLPCPGLELSSYDFPSLKHLWSSLGGLGALKIFTLEGVNDVDILPDEIGDLSQLERLELRECSFRTLPTTFGRLARLKHLKFSFCALLNSLPQSFGQLSSLEDLRFEGPCVLHTLPQSFGRLSSLEDLRFDCCYSLHTLPESFGQLSTLARLSFCNCHNLHTLPESFGRLSTLAHLSFQDCPNLQTLPNLPSFCPFPSLQFLEVHDCPRIDSLLFFTGESPAALRHLRIGFLTWTSIPECVKSFSSLEILEISALPYVNEFPPWLGGTSLGRPTMLQWTFNMKDGKLALQEEKKLDSWNLKHLVNWVHKKAILKLDYAGAPNFVGALAHLDALDPEMLPHMQSGFILLERGILKRETGDLNGALKDVTNALEKFSFLSQSQILHDYDYEDEQDMKYRCLTHRGYIRCLAEDEEGARDDAREALKFPVRVYPYDSPTRSLGLEGIEEWKKQAKLMLSQARQQAMEKVRASELVGALAALDMVRPHLLEECCKSFFFRERGVLKRLLRDLEGALADLTDALEIMFKHFGKDDYECRKHRGFVKYLLDDLDGARTDAERAMAIRAMAIMPNDCEEWNNTMEVAPGNRRFLGNDPIEFLGFTLPPRT